MSVTIEEFFTDGARIESAFRRFIHRASPQQKEDSTEVIVCHANVIRYFICRLVLLSVIAHITIFYFQGITVSS